MLVTIITIVMVAVIVMLIHSKNKEEENAMIGRVVEVVVQILTL